LKSNAIAVDTSSAAAGNIPVVAFAAAAEALFTLALMLPRFAVTHSMAAGDTYNGSVILRASHH
jgi:hypothetical protein